MSERIAVSALEDFFRASSPVTGMPQTVPL